MNLENFCLVLDDFLDPDLAKKASGFIKSGNFSSFFIKKDELPNQKHKDNQCILDIINYTWNKKLKFDCSKILGFEVWDNTMSTETTLGLHVDVDEYEERKSGKIVHPMYTSVLYLDPQNKIEGGDLKLNLVNTEKDLTCKNQYELIEEEGKCSDPNNNNWLTIPFRYNRLVVFDPTRPHLVTDITSGATPENPRVGLTMAAWHYQLKSL